MIRLTYFSLTLTFISFLLVSSVDGADRILLRDLTLLRNVSVDSFNEQGVRLESGRILTWDQIDWATLDSDEQARFDELRSSLGDSLFRVRQRLANRDFGEAMEFAKSLSGKLKTDSGPTSLLLSTALFRGQIAAGERIGSLIPLMKYSSIRGLEASPPKWMSDLQENMSPVEADAETGLSNELLPIWFDEDVAKNSILEINKQFESNRMKLPKAMEFYIGSLAVAANNLDLAKKLLASLEEKVELEKLARILKSQIALAEDEPDVALTGLKDLLSDRNRQIRILALYWTGKAKSRGDREETRLAALAFLQIAASYGEVFPSIAAGAISDSIELLKIDGDKLGAEALKKELLQKYPMSWHAKKLKRESELAQGK